MIGVLILAGLGATIGAADWELPLRSTAYSSSSQHSHREISRLPGYNGPLPSRHYSGMCLTQYLGQIPCEFYRSYN